MRQAEAQLDAGQPPAIAAAAVLQAAAAAADIHAPLLAQIRELAQQARIPLDAPDAPAREQAPPALDPAPYRLTGRELDVLRLLAAGHTNAQLAAIQEVTVMKSCLHTPCADAGPVPASFESNSPLSSPNRSASGSLASSAQHA